MEIPVAVGRQLSAAGLVAVPQGQGLAVGPLPALGADQAPVAGAEDFPELFLAGTFRGFGQPRLGLLTAGGQWPGPVVTGSGVRATLIRPDGIYLAGSFSSMAGQRRAGLARLSRDGVLDPAWHPEVQGVVQTMRLVGTRLYLGGEFTAVDGAPRRNLAVLDLSSGKVLDWQPQVDGPVWALAGGDGGPLYVGGAFLAVGDVACERLAKISIEDGAADPAFAIPCDGEVRVLIQRQQSLYVGGMFQRIGSLRRGGVAKISLATGQLAGDWQAHVDGLVLAMAAEGDHLYLGGTFTTVGGTPRANLARVELASGVTEPWVADTNEGVTALAEEPSGELLVAGRFSQVAGQSSAGLARISAAGVVANGWQPVAGGAATCLASDGTLVVAGGSTVLDGPERHGVAGLNREAGISRWQIDVAGNEPRVTALAVTRDMVYLGGDFTTINGVPRVNLARIDRRNGAVDLSWRADTDSLVRSVVLQGKFLYVGGNFSRLAKAAQPFVGRVATVAGTIDAWNPAVNGPVFAIAPVPTVPKGSEELWLAGAFTKVGEAPHHGLAKVSAVDASPVAGTPDLRDAQDQPGLGNACLALPDGRLVIGGEFATVGTQPRANLALLAADGRPVDSWRVDTDAGVRALASDGQLLAIGGGFSHLGGQERIGLAVVSLAQGGAPLPAFAPMEGEVQALALHGEALWIGGGFPGGVARCAWPGGTRIASSPTDGLVQAIAGLPAASLK